MAMEKESPEGSGGRLVRKSLHTGNEGGDPEPKLRSAD